MHSPAARLGRQGHRDTAPGRCPYGCPPHSQHDSAAPPAVLAWSPPSRVWASA